MANVPLHLVAARLRPPPAPVDDDEDWDAVIARAKAQAAWAEMPATPPPSPSPAQAPKATQATLDALILGGMKKRVAPRPEFTARRRPGI
jgi:hypothetical protein